MTLAYYITHPDVVLDPEVPIERWPLSERGRARMRGVLAKPWAASLAQVFCSEEQKAIDGARILAASLGVPVTRIAALGENDRSATGFLPPHEFWSVVDEFFANPEESVRGWEPAAHAQARVLGAVKQGLAATGPQEPVAFVAHGGVGALLLCKLRGEPVSRAADQPPPPAGSPPGSGGGYWFSFDRETLEPASGWQPVD